MVAQHYRWDFVGLSTDTKPTPATSEKVVDGSTFYCSDTSKLYVFCKNTWYERKALGGGGGGTTYTAGDGIDITNTTISVDTNTIQEKLTAGTGIDITGSTISATGGGGGDTVYSTKTTSNSSTGGAVYIGNLGTDQTPVLDPSPTDNHYKYFWALPYSNNGASYGQPGNGSVNILGSAKGNSTVAIGLDAGSGSYGCKDAVMLGSNAGIGNYGVAIGSSAGTSQDSQGNVCIGASTGTTASNISNSVALGRTAKATRSGEVNVGATTSAYGYNSTNYRVIGGVHDGQLANDAVTVGQVNAVIDAINTALSTNIPHIGASS